MSGQKRIEGSHLGNVFNSSMELLAAAICVLSRTKATRIESDIDGNLVATPNLQSRPVPKGCTLVGTYRFASQRAVRNDLIEHARSLAHAEDQDIERQMGAVA